MADILTSAQPTDSITTELPPTQEPAGASPPPPEPPQQSDVSSSIPSEPPPIPPETPTDNPTPSASETVAATDSLIVPPKGTTSSQPPTPPADRTPKSQTQTPKPERKRGSKIGIILAAVLLLFITLPLGVYYISQQNQLNDIRSRAAGFCGYCNGSTCVTCQPGQTNQLDCRKDSDCGPYPPTVPTRPATCLSDQPTSDCASPGAECYNSKGTSYCCVHDLSGRTTWEPNTWGKCPTNPTCPWDHLSPCCPPTGDLCDTPGSYKCIKDPFASRCDLWSTSCPPAQRYYWNAIDWGNDYKAIAAKWCNGPTTPATPPPGGTPATTPPSNPPNNTPIPPQPPNPQCPAIQVYKGTKLYTTDTYSTLLPGDNITILVGLAASKIRINGATNFTTLTTKNAAGTYWEYDVSIPTDRTNFSIEVQ